MSETTEKPRYEKPLPDMRPEGDPFWAGTKEHKLLLPAGDDGKPFWYPRAYRPGTLEPAQWVESKGPFRTVRPSSSTSVRLLRDLFRPRTLTSP